LPPAPQPVAVAASADQGRPLAGVASAPTPTACAAFRLAWSEGLREARAGRFASAVREEGDLLRPDAALARPAPTPGSYNCRLVRLGSTDRRSPPFARFKPFFCYVEVEDDLLTIVKQTGSERPAGRLWEDDVATRLVFLGSVALGNEEQPKPYGEDPRATWPAWWSGSGRCAGGWCSLTRAPAPSSSSIELTPVADQPGVSIADPARGPRASARRRRRRSPADLFRAAGAARPSFTRPKMRALCKTLAAVDEAAEAAASPSLPCWWCGSRTAFPARAGGPAAGRSTASPASGPAPKRGG
jgi:hypothetical protein